MKQTRRQQIEAKFHDDYAKETLLKDIDVFSNLSLAAQEHRRALSLFGNIKGRKILDLGCGFGETAVLWALHGALVDAIDISSGMVTLAKKIARMHGVQKKCHIHQMASENLRFKNNCFDFVFGDGILHHVDIQQTIKEVHRVLKPNGIALFVDPLCYNPLINIYREKAKDVRTPTEKPLRFEDIEIMKKVFPSVRHEEYQFSTLLLFLWFYLIERKNPNKERYWRKFREIRGSLRFILSFLITVDRFVLRYVPPLRYFCWNTLIIMKK